MTPFIADPDLTKLCDCGCGEVMLATDSRGRPRRYAAQGHNLRAIDNFMAQSGAVAPFRGRSHSTATRKVLSKKASRPKPWLRGAGNGMATRRGPLNPNWKGGCTPERQLIYASAEYKALLRFVFARDGYRCVYCGEPKRGPRSIHAHHIKSWAEYPELRLEPTNLVTLCRPCHHDEHRKGGAANQ